MNTFKFIKKLCFLLTILTILFTNSSLYADSVSGTDTGETNCWKFDIVDMDVITANMNHSTNPRFAASFKVIPTGNPEDYLDGSGNPIQFYVNQFVKYGDSSGDHNMSDTHSYWSVGTSVQRKSGTDNEWEFTTRCSRSCAYDLEAGAVLNQGSYWGDYITITVRVGIDGWHTPVPYGTPGTKFRVKQFRFRAPQCLNKVNTVDGNTRFEEVTKWDKAENTLLTDGGDFNFHDVWRLTCKQNPAWIPSNWMEETLVYQCNWGNNSGGSWCREGNLKTNFTTEYSAQRMFDDSGNTSSGYRGWQNWHTFLPYLRNYKTYWGHDGVSLTGRRGYIYDVIGQNTFRWNYFGSSWYALQTWVPDYSPAYITCFYATTDRPSETPRLGVAASFGCQGKAGRYVPPYGIDISATGINGATVSYDSTNPRVFHTYEDFPITIKSDVRMRPQQCIAYINDYYVYCGSVSGTKKQGGNHWEVQWHDEAHFKANECTFNNSDATKLPRGTTAGKVHLKYKSGDEGGNIALENPFKITVRERPSTTISTNIQVTNTNTGSTSFVKEDWSANYYVSGGSKTIYFYADENGNGSREWSYYWEFSNDGYAGDFGTRTGSSVSWTATRRGNITAKLYVKYHKGHVDVVDGKYKIVDDGDVTELLNTKVLPLSLQDSLTNTEQQRLTLYVRPSDTNTVTRVAWRKLDSPYDRQCTYNSSLNYGEAVEGKIMNCSYVRSGHIGTTGSYQQFQYNGFVDVYYARYDENVTENRDYSKLDRWNGVKYGSVKYRWRIITPDDNENLADYGVTVLGGLTSWTKLPTTSGYNSMGSVVTVKVTPLVLKFEKPYGTNINPDKYFKIFLEAQFTDVKYVLNSNKTSFSTETIDRELVYPIIRSDKRFSVYNRSYNYPNYNNEVGVDENYSRVGSLGILTKINDGVPAQIKIKGPSFGKTGDPLKKNFIEVTVKDNNPNASIKNIELYYNSYNNNGESLGFSKAKLFDEDYSGSAFKSPALGDYVDNMKVPLNQSEKFNITNKSDNMTQSNIEGYDGKNLKNVHLYTEHIASDTHSSTLKRFYHLPDSFISNNEDLSKTIDYYAVAYVDDGFASDTSELCVKDKIHCVTSDVEHITINDNDRPFARITLVNPITGKSNVYQVKEAINDYLKSGESRNEAAVSKDVVYTKDAKCNVYCEDSSRARPVVLNKYVASDNEYSFDHPFEVIANQRFLCTTTIADNVMSKSNLKLEVDYKDAETKDRSYDKIKLAVDNKADALGSYTAVINDYIMFAKPEDDPQTMDFTITDASNNRRIIHIPVKVLPESAANLRILERVNEK